MSGKTQADETAPLVNATADWTLVNLYYTMTYGSSQSKFDELVFVLVSHYPFGAPNAGIWP